MIRRRLQLPGRPSLVFSHSYEFSKKKPTGLIAKIRHMVKETVDGTKKTYRDYRFTNELLRDKTLYGWLHVWYHLLPSFRHLVPETIHLFCLKCFRNIRHGVPDVACIKFGHFVSMRESRYDSIACDGERTALTISCRVGFSLYAIAVFVNQPDSYTEDYTAWELREMRRIKKDAIRLLPFSFFLVIPLLEALLPPYLLLFPNAFPSQYVPSSVKKRRLEANIANQEASILSYKGNGIGIFR